MAKPVTARVRALKPADVNAVLQSFVITSVVSTSGLDVLLVVTLFFLCLASIRASGGFFSGAYSLFAGIISACK